MITEIVIAVAGPVATIIVGWLTYKKWGGRQRTEAELQQAGALVKKAGADVTEQLTSTAVDLMKEMRIQLDLAIAQRVAAEEAHRKSEEIRREITTRLNQIEPVIQAEAGWATWARDQLMDLLDNWPKGRAKIPPILAIVPHTGGKR